ncbi:hypothetical protein [Spirosoma panaciterrae]|uniref:hypothetical protein n=1 Tax=Spirosoma panaciterrae TaxID=496058 RepID=UPI00037AD4BB|nr:hypothetical protein [Spirosoma panaciterrae]
MGKQASQYDKIFRENIEAVIPGLMQHILGINAVSSEELPDDVQHTKERKPDVLKKITDNQGNTFVLHLEFQLVDESKMVYRMAEYYVMLARKYELPVRQFVIFLGARKPSMPIRITSEYLTFHFPIIVFADLDYHIFLRSAQPEEVILGILGNFKEENPEEAARHIIHRLAETANGDFAFNRYFNQLRVLAQLRNLSDNLKDIAMDSLDNVFSIEKDFIYMIGLDKGEEKAKEEVVRNLLTKTSLSVEQVADVAGVSVEFVDKIRQKMADRE